MIAGDHDKARASRSPCWRPTRRGAALGRRAASGSASSSRSCCARWSRGGGGCSRASTASSRASRGCVARGARAWGRHKKSLSAETPRRRKGSPRAVLSARAVRARPGPRRAMCGKVWGVVRRRAQETRRGDGPRRRTWCGGKTKKRERRHCFRCLLAPLAAGACACPPRDTLRRGRRGLGFEGDTKTRRAARPVGSGRASKRDRGEVCSAVCVRP